MPEDLHRNGNVSRYSIDLASGMFLSLNGFACVR
jgi:hypothetical protein